MQAEFGRQALALLVNLQHETIFCFASVNTMANLFALIAAGPSLDFSLLEIESLHDRGAVFLVADSALQGFSQSFPKISANVFTVERRRHAYLKRWWDKSHISIYFYRGSENRNLPRGVSLSITQFKLLGEEGDFAPLYSPGTVLGVMLSFAVEKILASQSQSGEVHFLGADFCYIDNQVYSRLIVPHAPLTNRLKTLETWQLEMAFKKTGGIIAQNGHVLRTAFELAQARENMSGMIEKLPQTIEFFEYSPVGFSSEKVQKREPRMF